jgi:hypothetical protein
LALNRYASHDIHERCAWLDDQNLSDREKNDGANQCSREVVAMVIENCSQGQESNLEPICHYRVPCLAKRHVR